ncbi:hypothetical protein N7535_008037 [Penicillium sp. DV-2018c]|nr:hypothetical protein N7461_004073 [Penicillium sp. DV-2018c]KAJ5566399.1 hypothetical protein N7535_008037 [Penicillium sp. DV-2018c]
MVRALGTSTVNLRHIMEPKALFKHFFENFSIEDFLQVFYWIAPLLDWERASTKGKNFVRNIWANLATQMKRHLDIQDVAAAEGDWNQVIAFWDTMGRDPKYNSVKLTEFRQLPPKMKAAAKRPKEYPVRETFAVGLDEEAEDSEPAEYDEDAGDEMPFSP